LWINELLYYYETPLKMFKKLSHFILLASVALLFTACPNEKDKRTRVLMKTTMGDIEIALFDETPQHRDNFVKLAKEGFYDSLLFHRVISQFMIQGGDPESKNAPSGKMLGNGGPDYTVPAEFNNNLIHKKGALCAARQGDQINPEKASSGSQFYIVQGKVYDSIELTNMVQQIDTRRAQGEIQKYLFKPENRSELDKIRAFQSSNPDSLMLFIEDLKVKIGYEPFQYTPEQFKTYTTIGGTPFLDRDYTVYGEVVVGLDILDKIAASATDGADRPVQDVRIISIKILK
jgi:cyclophilin family peptidyl-prolyl cis-trans isomerase